MSAFRVTGPHVLAGTPGPICAGPPIPGLRAPDNTLLRQACWERVACSDRRYVQIAGEVMAKKTCFVCAGLLLASLANASTIIYSTLGPGDSYDRSSGWTIGGAQVYMQGLQFIPSESAVVQTIEIAAFRNAGGTALNVALTSDAGDQPGSVLETVPICCFGAAASLKLANSVLRPLLTGGTKYWLVVSPVAVGDLFGWNRNLDFPPALNAQRSMGGNWILGLDWQGAMRIRGDAATPTKATTWGRLRSLYR